MSVAQNFVVRFAPSPTGYLHIGGARTALFNYLFAKNKGGKFLLRIEDTDKERSTKEAVEAILQGLSWLGLKYDDDFVLQSSRLQRHKEVALDLLAQGKAYYCYTSAFELDELRKNAEKKGEVFRFQSPWRDANRAPKDDEKPVIRIKAPKTGEIVIKDLVQGEVRVKCEEIDDLVLLRGDGTPTYMLAVVVDDCDMKITHIIRGDDHFTNTFRQKIIYDAMNLEAPQFAHIPLIHGEDGAKMSKRHGATSVIDYRQMGYLPEAMRNYLLRLGFSHGDDEIISDAKAIEWFDFKNVGKSPSRFDFAKLNHLNKHYIKQKNEVELFDLILEFFDKKPDEEEIECIKKSLKFSKEKAANLKELAQISEIYFSGKKGEFSDEVRLIFAQKREIISEINGLLTVLESWNHDSIKAAMEQCLEKNSLKMKDLGPLLRLILTFSPSSSGGIFDVVEILGKNEVLARIKNVL